MHTLLHILLQPLAACARLPRWSPTPSPASGPAPRASATRRRLGRRLRSCSTRLCVAAAIACPLSAQALHWIDPAGGPGADFTSLNQSVLDQVEDGDVLILRAGDYATGPLELAGKSLTLIAAAPSAPGVREVRLDIDGAFLVHDLALDQRVLLRGLDLVGDGRTVEAEDCAGTLTLDDCRLSLESFGQSALRLARCSDVLIVRSHLYAPPGPSSSIGNLDAVDSTLFVYDTLVFGNTSAAVGLRATDAMLSGSALVASGAAGSAAPGGSFTLIASASSQVELRSSTALPGTSATFSVDATSTLTETSLPVLSLDVASPAPQGLTAQLAVRAEPGAQVWLISALGGVPGTAVPPVDGTIHVYGAGFAIEPLGTASAAGRVTSQPLVPLIPGLTTLELHLQPLALPTSTGSFLFGAPRTLTVY